MFERSGWRGGVSVAAFGLKLCVYVEIKYLRFCKILGILMKCVFDGYICVLHKDIRIAGVRL